MTVQILKADQAISINNAREKSQCVVVTQGGVVKDYSVDYVSNWTSAIPEPIYNEDEDRDEYRYNIVLEKIDVDNELTFKSILGPGLYYGITAERFDQGNHIQSNFATNYYDGHSNIAEPDLASHMGGIIMSDAKAYDGHYINIGTSKTDGNLVIHTNKDQNNLLVNPRSHVTVVTSTYEDLKNNYVDPIINHGTKMSNQLVQHPATITPDIGTGKVLIDTTAFPDGATIYIEADQLAGNDDGSNNKLTNGNLKIRKRENQILVFNFDQKTNLKLGEFYVQYPDMSKYPSEATTTDGWIQSDTPTKQGPKNNALDQIARHIVWNCNSVTNLELGITAGIFLVPNVESYTDTAQTSSGWIITGGTFHNSGGEWHFNYRELEDVDSANLTVNKTVNTLVPAADEKFTFKIEKYTPSAQPDSSVTYSWQEIGSFENDGGTVSFTVSEKDGNLATGWNAYRITETAVSANNNSGKIYTLSNNVFYAAVNYKVAGNTDPSSQTTIKIASLPKYYSAFNEETFKANAATGADEESVGFANSSLLSSPTFSNQAIEIANLKVTKDLEGKEWDNEVFSFTISAVSAKDAENNDISPIPMPLKTIASATADEPTAVFGSVNYQTPGTYVYKIKEIAPEGAVLSADVKTAVKDYITYDLSEHTVTVTVTYDSATGIEASVDYGENEDKLIITNNFALNASAQLNATKQVKGRKAPNEDFTFVLTPVNANAQNASKVSFESGVAGKANASQEITVSGATVTNPVREFFKKIIYKLPGEYKYLITEKQGTTEGYTYDDSIYEVTITVGNDETVTQTIQKKDIEGNIIEDSSENIIFVNEYESNGLFVQKIWKNSSGIDISDTQAGTVYYKVYQIATEKPFETNMIWGKYGSNDGKTISEKLQKGTIVTLSVFNEQNAPVVRTYSKNGNYDYNFTVVQQDASSTGNNYIYKIEITSDITIEARTGNWATNEENMIFSWIEPSGSGQPLSQKFFPNNNQIYSLSNPNWTNEFTLVQTNNLAVGDPHKLPLEGTEGGKDVIYKYKIVETDSEGNEITDNVVYRNNDGVIMGDIYVENTIESSDNGDISLSVTKNMNPWLNGKEFEFNISGNAASGTSVDSTGKVTGFETSKKARESAKTVTFGPINFTAADDGKSFTFTITETWPGSATDDGNVYQGVTYDRNRHSVTVTPHVSGSSMTFEVTNDKNVTNSDIPSGTTVAAASFTNNYNVSGQETLRITKALAAGSWPQNKTVEFTLTPKTDGAPMPTIANGNKVTLSSVGEGSFGKITFGASHAEKTYVYEITETEGFGTGWSNNGPVTATIKVGPDTGTGTLATEVTYTNGGTITNNEAQSGSIAFSVTKNIKDSHVWPKDKSFTIILAAKDGDTNAQTKLNALNVSDLIQTVTASSRTATFPMINFTGDDADKEFKFVISEANKGTTADGITYSNTEYNILVTLTNESGQVTPHVSVDGEDKTSSISAGVLTLGPIVNEYNASGTFTVQAQKQIEDHDGNTTEERDFIFEVRYKGAETSTDPLVSKTVTDIKDGQTVDVIFDDAISFSLDTLAQLVTEGKARKSADSNTWEIDYTLTEKASTDKAMKPNNQSFDFTVTVTDNGNGTLSCTPSLSKTQMKFVNVELNNAILNLSGKKVLPERELTDSDKWTFTISSTNGGPLPDPASVVNSSADFSFNPITFTPQHLANNQQPATYIYEVRESGSITNVTNDTGVKQFTVTVSVVDGVLQAVIDPANLTETLTFTNHYYKAGSVVLGAKKSMENNVWPTGTTEYKFSITGTNDAARALLTSQSIDSEATASQTNPTAEFDAITFTQNDIENSPFKFIIKEVEPTGTTDHKKDGVTYSTDEYEVEIRLLTESGGIIVPVITSNGKPIGEDNAIYTIGEFTNAYTTDSCTFSLKASKQVIDADNQFDKERSFTFDLHYGSATAASIASKTVTLIDNQKVDINFDGITFTRAVLDDLVNDHYATESTVDGKRTWIINYVLTEQPSAATDKAMKENNQVFNVVVTVVDDGLGHLSCSYTPSTADLAFVNSERKDVKLNVSGGKDLTGRSLTADDKWTFTIEALDGGPLPASASVQNTLGTFTFGDITFTPQHLGNNASAVTYHYRVTESGKITSVYNFEGAKEFSVTLSVDDTTDELKAVSSPANLGDLLTFENHYHDEGTLVLAATKSMTANNWPTGTPTFTFKLEGTDDESKAKIGQSGLTATADRNNTTARFPQITFTEADEAIAKVYNFKVSEVIPEGAVDNVYKGVTYSNINYPVKVTLTNDGLGKITPVVTVNETNIPLTNNIFTVGNFSNTYNADNCTFTLEATKKVNDSDGKSDRDRIFFFDLRYSSAEAGSTPLASKEISIKDGETKDVTFDGITYTIESLTNMVNDNRATVGTVNGKRTWTINYVVTERIPTDTATSKAIKPNSQSFEVTVTVTDDGEGHLSCTSSPSKSERRFVNDERKDTSINISGSKKLTGRALTESDTWTYTISSTDGGPMPASRSVTNTMGSFTFGDIVFTPQELGANATAITYHYTITESGEVAAVTNDSAKNFTVTLSVDPSTNELKAVTDPTNLSTLLTFKTSTMKKVLCRSRYKRP